LLISVDDDDLLPNIFSLLYMCVSMGGWDVCVCAGSAEEVPSVSFYFFFIISALPYFRSQANGLCRIAVGSGRNRFFLYKKKYFYIHLNLMKKILVRISWSILFSSSISDVCAAHVDTQRETLSPPSHRNVV
jgi:hypothetical protein